MTWSRPDPSALVESIAAKRRGNERRKSSERRKQWNPETIRTARRTPLPAFLRTRGYRLRELPKENFLVERHADLVVKEHYWVWPSMDLKGNAIDFLMLVECLTFDQAMEEITRPAG